MVQPQFDNRQPGNDPEADLVSSAVTDTASNPIHSLNHPPAHNESLFRNELVQFVTNEQVTYWSGETSVGNDWKVYVGDAKSVLSFLSDNTFQCVITSPPYYWLRDYGVEGQIGKEWKIDEYVQAIANVMDHVKRVLAPDGILFLNLGDTYYSGKGESQGVDKKSRKRRFGLRAVDASGLGVPQKSLIGIPWRIALEMIDRDWILRSSIIWDRLNPLPESARDRPGRTYENIFMFVKSRKYYFNQQALNGQREDLWSIEARPKPTPGISTAPFPDELVQKCINVGCPENGRILEAYYNPRPESKYYYVPLRSTGRVNRWVSKVKYPDSGLQKTRTTSFIRAFLHPSNSDEWAWVPDYLSILSNTRNVKVPLPAFHLAVWILRDHDWPESTQPEDIIEFFFEFFHISEEEKESLFDTKLPHSLFPTETFQKEPVTWKSLRKLIDAPPDEAPDEGGGLESLELIGIGPAKHIELDLAQRLNIITGDNGLGKTFFLECAWWALSGHWADPEQPAYPRSDSVKPGIKFQISGSTAKPESIFYNRANQTWPLPNEKRPVLPGIVVYVRVDGSCVIWDPAKHYWSLESNKAQGLETTDAIRLSNNNIWNGLERDLRNGGRQYVCNGLVRDWVTWQYISSTNAFETFSRVLQRLSLSTEITLIPGELTKLPRDTRDMPTLKLPYDDVPIVLLSAGIKRILTMAYLLVWTWETHKEASKNIGKPPQSKIVFIVDEMEAHLHPRWQRVIVPALLDVVKDLEKSLEIQLIIATHSPLVLASIEPVFNDELDPFTIEKNRFFLDFPSLMLRSNPELPKQLREQIETTIKRLKLNEDEAFVDDRSAWLKRYCLGRIKFHELKRVAPFTAYELERQNLVEDIKIIMRYMPDEEDE